MHKDITKNNFQINNNQVTIKNIQKPGMLFVHADWCGHCTRFMPIFKEISSQIGNDFTFLAIESKNLDDKTSRALEVKYFPTIKFFNQNGQVIGTYPENQARTKRDILDYICKVYHKCILNN